MVIQQALDGLDGQERHVARQDQDGPLAARILGLDHGVTGAETFALDHGEDALSRHLGDAIGARRDDHHHPIGESPGQPQGVADQRPTTEAVQDLRLARAHALALAGSKDDGGHCIHRMPLILETYECPT